MTTMPELTQILQAQVAPFLADTVQALTTALVQGRTAEEIARIPNIGLLLQACTNAHLTDGRKVLDFGTNNQYGDVQIKDIVLGSQYTLHIHLSAQDTPSLLNRVEALHMEPSDLAQGNTNAAPLPASIPQRPCRVLVFDGGCNGSSAQQMRQELRLRGILSPDPNPLELPTAQTLHDDLSAADAAIVILSTTSCQAPRLKEQELPAIWGRYGRAEPFGIIPLIDGVSTAVADTILTLPGTQLSDFHVFQLPAQPTEQQQALARLAGMIMRSIVTPRLRHTSHPIRLVCFSYPPSGSVPVSDLMLDWFAFFPEPDHPTCPPPDPAVWRTRLDPALADLRTVVGMAGVQTLAISGNYHLPVGLALGFRFRTVVGIELQIDAQPESVWVHPGPADAGELLVRKNIAGNPQATDLSIEVSLNRTVREDAQAYLEHHNIAVVQRVQLTSRPLGKGDVQAARYFITSATHARRIANQICNIILNHNSGTIHLFAAIPKALAVLIAAQLNRVRPVQCYELYDDPELRRMYVPAGRLG